MGLLGDMAKAAAKVAINQVSNTAHEKVSEMFPTKEIVLSGSHERDVYTYYGGPLKGIRVGQTFDAEVARKPVTLVSELTGTEWNTAEHGNNALMYRGKPFGSFSPMSTSIRKMIRMGYRVKIRCKNVGWYAQGIPEIVAMIPDPEAVFSWLDECERSGEEVPFNANS